MTLLYDFIFLLGIILSGIYMIMLFQVSVKSMPHRVLVLFFGVVILILLESYAILHKIKVLAMITFVPASSSKLILGGLLFLYIKLLFYDVKVVLKRYWVIFIPLVLFILLYSIPTLIALYSYKYFLGHLNILNNYNYIVRIVSDGIFFSYLILCFRTFFKLKKTLDCNYAEVRHNNFIWIRYLLFAAMGVILIDFIFALSLSVFEIPLRTQNVVMVLLVVSVIYTAYFGLNQSKVLVPKFLLEDNLKPKLKETIKFINQNDKVELEMIELKLKQVLLKGRPYLDPELTLGKLAGLLDISDKKLSTFLNDHLKVTFYDFVNNCRVEAFMEAVKLSKNDCLTIEAIALECGFKSRATFYRVFKLKTNISPSQYKKQVK